jgi:hypothetical protein
VSVISINLSKAPADPSNAGISFNARLKFRVDIISSSNRVCIKDKTSSESSGVFSEVFPVEKGALSCES